MNAILVHTLFVFAVFLSFEHFAFLGYRSGGPGSIPSTTRKKIKVVGLERGPLGLVTTAEELLDRKVAAPI
jgi:hypothetical protein